MSVSRPHLVARAALLLLLVGTRGLAAPPAPTGEVSIREGILARIAALPLRRSETVDSPEPEPGPAMAALAALDHASVVLGRLPGVHERESRYSAALDETLAIQGFATAVSRRQLELLARGGRRTPAGVMSDLLARGGRGQRTRARSGSSSE